MENKIIEMQTKIENGKKTLQKIQNGQKQNGKEIKNGNNTISNIKESRKENIKGIIQKNKLIKTVGIILFIAIIIPIIVHLTSKNNNNLKPLISTLMKMKF